MNKTPLLLRPVKNAKHAAKASKKATCKRKTSEQRYEQLVHKNSPTGYSHLARIIFTATDPVVLRYVHRHLDAPSQGDRMLLDAWERVGRQDAIRAHPCDYKTATLRTYTPLGLACLIRYARGYEDEAASRQPPTSQE